MKKYLSEAKKNLKKLISIPSEQKEAALNMPFGKDVYDALDFSLKLGEELGFKTLNYDNYIGEIIFGQGEPFAVLCHLDVVPAGNGWTVPPFEATEKDGKIYGRGAMDDKSPFIAVLYAMKKLKDEGIIPSRTIKLILGCNEESGWQCIEHYKKVAVLPETGFSPDGEFPVTYAEKGILKIKIKSKSNGKAVSVIGGERANMVCDKVIIKTACGQNAEQFGLKREGDYLIAEGKTAHGSMPEQGENAIKKAFEFLEEKELLNLLFCGGLDFSEIKDESGIVTFSPNIIYTENGDYFITVDIRYPATYKEKDVLNILDKNNIKYKVLGHTAPIFAEKDGFLVKTLCNVYNSITGENTKPITTGGGTYARALKCGVAFGPEFPNQENTIHKADEYVTEENLLLLSEIYYNALKQLTCKN